MATKAAEMALGGAIISEGLQVTGDNERQGFSGIRVHTQQHPFIEPNWVPPFSFV